MPSLSTFVRIALTGGFLAALSLVTPANAGPIAPSRTWDLSSSTGKVTRTNAGYGGSSKGNEYQFKSTANDTAILGRAFHIDNVSSKTGEQFTNPLVKDYLGVYSGGLGVENTGSPGHAMDNDSGWDFIVFKLPAGNNWNNFSFLLDPYGSYRDMHATVLYGTPNASLGISGLADFAGKTVNQLLGGGFLSMNFDGMFLDNTNKLQTISFNTTTQVNYIIIAASLQPFRISDDNFKVRSITGKVVTYVPESPTLAAFGAGLLGLGVFAARRRKTAKQAA